MRRAPLSVAIMALGILTALLVVVAGCTSGGSNSPAPAASQKASSSPSSSAAPSASAKPAPSGPEAILAELAKLPAAERQQKLEEGAKKEGKLVVYATGDIESWEAFKKGFTQKYPGVSFDFLRGGGDELMERMLAEARAGKLAPDLVHHNKGHILEDQGLVIPYTSPAKERIPERFRTAIQTSIDVNPIVFAWNTNLVKPQDAPKKWEDLLDPKWKGRKMTLDAMPDVMLYGLYIKWGEERGRDYLRKLMAQDLIPSRSHTTALDQLAAGEFPIAAEAYGYRAVQLMRGKGAPIAWAVPDPRATTGGGIMITKTTTRPYAAALLYDYLSSDEVGTIYGTFGRLPTAPGAKLQYPEEQRPLLDAAGIINLSPEYVRKWYDTVMKDIKDIVQPALGQ